MLTTGDINVNYRYRGLFLRVLLLFLFASSFVNAQTARAENTDKPAVSQPGNSLSEKDRDILDRGEIGTTRYVLGGILAVYPGFGVGQAVQLRFQDRGWIFTVGELASGVMIATGLVSCVFGSILTDPGACSNPAMTLGLVAFTGFKIWEIVDAWAVPPMLNERYRQLKKQNLTWHGGFLPTPGGGMFMAQITF